VFGFLKKKETEIPQIELPPLEIDGEKEIICSPLNGKAVNCEGIKDLTFRGEMLGKTVAIRPTDGKVYAPADGKVEMLMETMHAVSMTTEKGTEILIHVGIDTVELNGKYFKSYIKTGNQVKRGDLLLEFNVEKIAEAGYNMIVPVIICNSDDYSEVEKILDKEIKVGETLMKLSK
jgi:glucose-specific phosphotransferase system IIA component